MTIRPIRIESRRRECARAILRLLAASLLLGSSLALAASCASLQRDLLASSAGSEADGDIGSLERAIAPLDVAPSPEGFKKAGDLVDSLKRKGIKDAAFEARLAAWAGRLALANGARLEAVRLAARSSALLPGDVPGMILGIRLEQSPEGRLEKADTALSVEPSSGQLTLERARALYALARYREAVAAFDAAFPALPGFYEPLWKETRNRAWALRDLAAGSGSAIAAIVASDSIVWRDAIALAREEQKLPERILARKGRTADGIFKDLVSASFIPSSVALPAMPLTRADAAYFLWHILADRLGDPSLLAKYATLYRARPGTASPVPDVPLDAYYFDAALGSVEREIMALTDGVRFSPDLPVRGSDFLAMLRRIP